MLPDWVLNPQPLALELDAPLTALSGPKETRNHKNCPVQLNPIALRMATPWRFGGSECNMVNLPDAVVATAFASSPSML